MNQSVDVEDLQFFINKDRLMEDEKSKKKAKAKDQDKKKENTM